MIITRIGQHKAHIGKSVHVKTTQLLEVKDTFTMISPSSSACVRGMNTGTNVSLDGS